MTARSQLLGAATVAVGLGAVGAVLGLVWSAWSGPQQRAYVIGPGKLYPYDEVETFVASDGRFLVITAAVGLLAGAAAWWWVSRRGPLLVLGLAVGGLGGAALTALIGHLTGGGTFAGRPDTIIAHLPLSVHMSGLFFVEAALAVLVYSLFAAFSSHDDLGRPDPAREALLAARRDADPTVVS